MPCPGQARDNVPECRKALRENDGKSSNHSNFACACNFEEMPIFVLCLRFLVARMDTTSGILIVLCLKSRISKDQDWLTDLITLDMFNWTLICWEDTTIGEEGVWSMEVQNTLFYGYYYCKEWREQHLICVEIAISCNSCIYWVYGRRLLNQLLET